MRTATPAIGIREDIRMGLQTSTYCGDDSGAFADSGAFYAEAALDFRRSVTSSAYPDPTVQPHLRDALYHVCKRGLDLLVSFGALVLLSPIILITALMIKLYDGGPVIFTQKRVGKDGREFRCFKFRSMVLNADSLKENLMDQSWHADPRTFKMANDPRITPPGRIIRRFSIDELPQILNVFLGDMSIVGPRPPVPSEVARYTDSDFRRLAVKPGLTCIWQVSGRSRLPFPEQVKLDVEYIQRRSLAFDLSIILRTVPAVLSGDGAI
ncbi:MAG: sugar transferase [Planctomycetales bacterium]|nr:sugar transferase [Planctomycetales bacterium]